MHAIDMPQGGLPQGSIYRHATVRSPMVGSGQYIDMPQGGIPQREVCSKHPTGGSVWGGLPQREVCSKHTTGMSPTEGIGHIYRHATVRSPTEGSGQ